MALLEQSKDGYASYLGWYGKCEQTDCNQGYDLSDETRIYTVYRTEPGGGIGSYTKGVPPFMNKIDELECGNAYWIVLIPGEDTIDISDFTISDSEVSSPEALKSMIKSCTGGDPDATPTPVAPDAPTPTPVAPTPTPVPSASKKLKLPVILLAWNTGNTNTSLHFTSNPLQMGGKTKRFATKSDIEDMFNGSNYSWPYTPEKSKPSGSAKEYYKAISFGQLDLQFEVLPASEDPNPTSNNLNDFAYVVNEDYRECGHGKANRSYNHLRAILAQKVFPQVLKNLKARGLDFYKEFWAGVPLTIIQAGFSASSVSKNRNDFIWAHKFQFRFNGRNQLYNINPFLGKMTSRGDLDRATISPVGVIVHETLHAFGLPDLYDSTYKGVGMNKIAVMASGSYGNAFSSVPYLPSFAISWSRNLLSKQKKLFETDVVEIRSDVANLEIFPSNDKNKLYKIYHPSTSDVWWVDYRTKESSGHGPVNFDKLISDNGLAIIHESTTSGSRNNKSKQPIHRRGESGYFISIEQSDGRFDTQRSGRNISNDLWKEGQEFSPHSIPSTTSRSGVPSGIKVHNIRKTDNGSMLFDVTFMSEPASKIVSIDYSWGNTSQPLTSSKRAEWKESSAYGQLTATVKTENISDGTTINMQVNPVSYESSGNTVRASGNVSNDECIISFTGPQLDSWTRESSKGVTNYIRFSVDGDGSHTETYPWIDFVVVRP